MEYSNVGSSGCQVEIKFNNRLFLSGWTPPDGSRVGGEAAHSATARLPSPPGNQE
jgi:hypothetical protein